MNTKLYIYKRRVRN